MENQRRPTASRDAADGQTVLDSDDVDNDVVPKAKKPRTRSDGPVDVIQIDTDDFDASSLTVASTCTKVILSASDVEEVITARTLRSTILFLAASFDTREATSPPLNASDRWEKLDKKKQDMKLAEDELSKKLRENRAKRIKDVKDHQTFTKPYVPRDYFVSNFACIITQYYLYL